MTRTSTVTGFSPPSRSITPVSSTRSSFACASAPRSPTSSRNSVPRSASSKRPMRRSVAPVNAPRSWPNISDSTKSLGIAALLTQMNGLAARALWRWIADATSSLPVPDSPVISTRASVGAIRAISARSRSIASLTPTSGSLWPSASCSRRFSAMARDSSTAARSVVSTPSGVSGFSRNWSAPSLVARTASARLALPLIITTGTSGAIRLSCSSVASPSGPPGMERSRSTASGRSRWTASTAAVPSAASTESNPSDCSSAPTIRRRREVGLEHAVPQLLRDPRPVIRDGDAQTVPVPAHADLDRPAAAHRFGRVAQQVRERAPQRVVPAEDRAGAAVGPDRHRHGGWHRAAAQVRQEIDQVHFALRALGKPAELRELPRQPLQPLGLGRQHLHCRLGPPIRPRPTGRRPQLVYRDAHRRERVLDFVAHPARHLAERAQPLGLELLRARGVERRRELAQGLPQGFELGRAARRPPGGQRGAAPDQPGPAHQLVDRPRQLA